MEAEAADVAPSGQEAEAAATSAKHKPKQKTAHQKEVLEAAFNEEAHPSEHVRAKLATDLGLSVGEVTSWFQNKRRRVKHKPDGGQPAATASPSPASAVKMAAVAHDGGEQCEIPGTFSSVEEYEQLRGQAQAALPAGYREDGPMLGFFFDEPNSAPTVKRKLDGKLVGSPTTASKAPRKGGPDPQNAAAALQKQLIECEKKAMKQQEKAAREQAKLDVTLRKEQERRNREHEKERARLEKEAIKQEQERAKAEERKRKNEQKLRERMEKEQQKLMLKQSREEQRKQKLAQKEQQRMQAKEAKEREKLDKKRQREAQRLEREAQRKQKASMKQKAKDSGPVDDLDLELECLAERRDGEHADDSEEEAAENWHLIERPPWPGESVMMHSHPLFEGVLGGLDEAQSALGHPDLVRAGEGERLM